MNNFVLEFTEAPVVFIDQQGAERVKAFTFPDEASVCFSKPAVLLILRLVNVKHVLFHECEHQ